MFEKIKLSERIKNLTKKVLSILDSASFSLVNTLREYSYYKTIKEIPKDNIKDGDYILKNSIVYKKEGNKIISVNGNKAFSTRPSVKDVILFPKEVIEKQLAELREKFNVTINLGDKYIIDFGGVSNLFGKLSINFEGKIVLVDNDGVEKDLLNSNTKNNKKLVRIKDNFDQAAINFFDEFKADVYLHGLKFDDYTFYFTDAYKEGNRVIIFGFSKDNRLNKKFEPRVFYYSQSGGNWHSAPGITEDGRYSKGSPWGVSYEKGTVVVDKKLVETLNKLAGFEKNKEFNIEPENISNVTKRLSDIGFNSEDYCDKVRPVTEVYNLDEQNPRDKNNEEELKKLFKSLDISFFDLDWMEIKDSYTLQHPYLGETKVDVVEVLLWKGKGERQKGEKVNIEFRYTTKDPDLVWIENIIFKDNKMNSYGIPERQINAGLFTTKPIEYSHRIPKDVIDKNQTYGSHNPRFDDPNIGMYVDIRKYIQENPLVKWYKEKRSL